MLNFQSDPQRFIAFNGKPLFVTGVNLPWFDGAFGHDLGPNHYMRWNDVHYRGNVVRQYFRDCREIGFNVVRVWLFEQGEGLQLDGNYRVSGLDPLFLENLHDLVRAAAELSLPIYACLTDWKHVPLEFPNPVLNDDARRAYVANAVIPLTQMFRDHLAFFAFDVFNEIEAERADRQNGGRLDRPATRDEVRRFIGECVCAIKGADDNRLVSAGAGWEPAVRNLIDRDYSDLRLDFYDIHRYSDTGIIPTVDELQLDAPVILGEFGQQSDQIDDEIQRRADESFLENVLKNGYAGFLAWTYFDKDAAGSKKHSLLYDSGQHRPVVEMFRRRIAAIRRSVESH